MHKLQLRTALEYVFLISVLLYFLGEKLLFTKGAESSILPRSKSGEIDKTRIHVDEFALVSLYVCPADGKKILPVQIL